MPYQPLVLPPTEPWSGLWDLDCEVELRGMMDGLLRQGHLLAVYRLGSDIQVGWRHQTSAYEVWEMPLLTPQAALRDATSRFFRSLKQGRNAVFSHPCIASSALAVPMTQQPLPKLTVPAAGSPMTAKEYCSRICGAKCCKAHEPIVWPLKCPKLTDDNLCSIYETRIGFRFDALASDGGRGKCVCSGPKTFVKTLPPEVQVQCCFAHPELLEREETAPPTQA